MIKKAVFLIMVVLFLIPTLVLAQSAADDLKQANGYVEQAMQYAGKGDFGNAQEQYKAFSTSWFTNEDGIKQKSKAAYRMIEDAMGEVQFAFAQQPVNQADVLAGLKKLAEHNGNFINGNLASFGELKSAAIQNGNVSDLVALLDQALQNVQQNRLLAAKSNMEAFRQSWLDIEGIVLTQSGKVYSDAERDMLVSYAQLSSNPPDAGAAEQTIRDMRTYLAPLASKTSYTMLDVVTIFLREGLEALLVIVALMGFLNKSGHADKKHWIWYGLGGGILTSLILGIIVKILFSSGAFGSNNFLIAGCTGIFAAFMLSYMGYWLHSKSSVSSWKRYINEKSTKALATGSLFSLAALSFLAVFREGTETVLFFIGMASSIDLSNLLGGIVMGLLTLSLISYLILKVGVKIPMQPFFKISSILVFYLCFKFLGMGVHGLQLAGVVQATHTKVIPSIEFLALYATWENIIPQAVLVLTAIILVLWNRRKDFKFRQQMQIQKTTL